MPKQETKPGFGGRSKEANASRETTVKYFLRQL